MMAFPGRLGSRVSEDFVMLHAKGGHPGCIWPNLSSLVGADAVLGLHLLNITLVLERAFAS